MIVLVEDVLELSAVNIHSEHFNINQNIFQNIIL